MDFVRAANRAPEGRSIIALQSTNRDRTRSRIVAKLADGIVTTPRAEADCVVTEHGIAELRGRTLAERARALIAVADPAFRAELERGSERLCCRGGEGGSAAARASRSRSSGAISSCRLPGLLEPEPRHRRLMLGREAGELDVYLREAQGESAGIIAML